MINMNAYMFSHGFILIFSALFALILSVFCECKNNIYRIISFVSLLLSLMVLFLLDFGEAFNGLFVFDFMAKMSSVIILIASLLFVMSEDEIDGDFCALFLFMVANFISLSSTNNLIVMFVSLEASSLALFTLIAKKGTKMAIGAGLKYFIYSVISASFFCFASALFYLQTKSVDVTNTLTTSILSFFVIALFFVLIAFKLSLAPFHLWILDVYKNAKENLSGYISVVPKMAIFVIAFRIFFTNLDIVYDVLFLPCCFSMIFAGILAIRSSSFKEVLVYSSLVNCSFVFTLVTTNYEFKIYTFNALFFYWGVFTFINIALFLFLSVSKKDNIFEFNGFLTQHKVLGGVIVFLLVSLGAIPPFGLFFPKMITMLLNASSMHMIFVLCLAITSVLIAITYAKIIKAIAFTKKIDDSLIKLELSMPQKIVFFFGFIVGLCAIFIVNVIECMI